MMKSMKLKKRILSVLCLMFLLLLQVAVLFPQKAYAETPGETLVVRVQYVGEREEKIREKARFSSSELEAMGASTYNYTNVTDVGTVMSTIGHGPALLTIISRAGVDLNSIKYITFRTSDGTGEHQRYTRNYTVGNHLTAARYFYPLLSDNYERNDDERSLTPLAGSLKNKVSVPSILAITSYSTKNAGKTPSSSELRSDDSYRFCLGQTPLTEGKSTAQGYDGGDVSSMDSAVDIFGIDITLYGSPVTGIRLDLDNNDIKVGSQKKISAVIEGDELFSDDWGFGIDDFTWSSSDTDIATVNDEGVITVKKEGEVVITATAPNGMTASITINGKGDGKEDSGAGDEKAAAGKKDADKRDHQKDSSSKSRKDKDSDKKMSGIKVREVSISGIVAEDVSADDMNRQQMSSDSQALDAADESSDGAKVVSAVLGTQIITLGAVFRIRRFFMEV